MTEYKKITEKEVWLIMKTYSGGAKDFIGAYWDKDVAKKVASENIPDHTNFTISMHSVILHGLAIDVK